MVQLYDSLVSMDICSILEQMGDAICVADKDFNIHSANKKFAEMYGLTIDKVIGRNGHDLYPGFEKSVFYQITQKTIQTGKKCAQVGYSLNTKRWIVCRTFKYDENNYILAVHEMSKEEENGYMNKVDTLSSLANRFAFEEDIKNILTIGQRFGVILIDINRFHSLNETLGFDVGDRVLMEVSSRLLQNITGGNKIYRLGGDQFLVLSMQDSHSFHNEISSISNIFNEPLFIKDKPLNLNTTIGYYYTNDANNEDTSSMLLKKVETALFSAKKARVRSLEFTESMNPTSNALEAEHDLRQGLANNEFVLYYQPQLDLKTKKVIGAESLIRWKHPTKGFVSPAEFLPFAEELNLMKEVDMWVIQKAVEHLNNLSAHDIDTKISVNLSADSISSLSTTDFITKTLQNAGMTHDMLSFEITESSLMHNVDISKQVIANLNVNGSQIAIDDFGTGYSSMEYLIKYPSDYLKIDREFIKEMSTSKTHRIMVANIIKMGHSLGMKIIAEGIELQEEQDLLVNMGCDMIQGYFYAKPMPFEDFKVFLKNNS